MLYCPKCGVKSLATIKNQFNCSECDFTFFQNMAAAVMAAVIKQNADSETMLLVATRSREPGKGQWDLPGGYVDPHESAETALNRELKEEIGVEPKSFQYLTSFPNVYPYKEVVYTTCDMVFIVTLDDEAQIIADDDVESLSWMPLDEIDLNGFAFESTKQAVSALRAHLAQ
ncbi:nucleotide pyrophosphohydrolase [Vibrio breoganii]|uniref:NUDIX hydrolase n=1 Tax=Vibrio breoganii TaxID=553239 RepID=UPI000C81D960|nr:NUDIX domain-containing protein [Vibrio breoganii]PML95336.1 nucleotide pyrophosphohydrolase [Vibrio breoganii]PMN66196.1 nucleotide pyrophosphohydrolase [Vibrio breoganii]PMO63444.1 nucleotide pyrophosphohydrolase [Vibrio breoganii]